MFEPAVKWSGSKRSQAEEIISFFPKEIDTYYEPFCGGCSVLRQLLERKDIRVKKFVCSDINADLIALWKMIKNNPETLGDYYDQLWHELNIDDNKERKKNYFGSVRDRYNREHDPKDFLFIMRTTTNGMPRYNKDGKFNNSFHVTRDGIVPITLKKILLEWSTLLQFYDVQFISCNYKEINSNENDLLYLDPPYYNTKGMYMPGSMIFEEFFNWLGEQKGYYLLSFDGISGEEDNTYSVPKNLYSVHKYLRSGNSSFKRTIGKSNNSIVYESLYLK